MRFVVREPEERIHPNYARNIFPADTVEVKFVYEGDFAAVDIGLNVFVRLLPTDNVRNTVQQHIDDGMHTYFGGWGSGSVNGEYAMSSDRIGCSGTTWKDLVYYFTPAAKESTVVKATQSVIIDKEKSLQKATILVRAGNTVRSQAAVMGPYTMTDGTFYDLLPAGTYVNTDSIRVYVSDAAINAQSVIKEIPAGTPGYTVDFEPNYQGSGQTMMKVAVSGLDPDEYAVYSGSFVYPYQSHVISLQYDLINSYQNIVDRGARPVNTVAFVNQSGENVQIIPRSPRSRSTMIFPE